MREEMLTVAVAADPVEIEAETSLRPRSLDEFVGQG
jgi:Holliday junction resolvasome RuvABC ATP-dependent DNA helicase subunit